MEKAAKILTKAITILNLVFLFGLPLFFAPFLANTYELGKEIFIVSFILLSFILWTASSLLEKKLVLRKNPYLLLLFLFFLAFVVSTFVNAPNRLLAIASTFGPGTLLILLMAFFFLQNQKEKQIFYWPLLASGTVLSIFTAIMSLTNLQTIALPGGITITKGFSPTGSIATQTIFLLALIPLGFGFLYHHIKNQKMLPALVTFILNALILVGVGIGVYLLSTTSKMVLLPQSTAWAIALETLKSGRLALFGLGPGQFTNAFTAFKPLSFNASEYWNLRFASSSNWYFQLLTEIGITGLILYLIMGWKIIKSGLIALREKEVSAFRLSVYGSLTLMLITQLFLPLGFFSLAFFIIVLAMVPSENESEIDLKPLKELSLLIFVIPLVILGAVTFFSAKIALANSYFQKSADAYNRNDGVGAYDLQIKAIQTDGNVPAYRIAYSQTNFALANAIAAKKDLTDQDRNTITQLTQQAIRESKSATAIDPRSADAWENLAGLYRNLINFAEGADQWSIAAYQQAINLDPLSPRLRIDLGGLYYSQKAFDQAISNFVTAVNLKNDFANAYYNLANALREKGQLQDALTSYQTAQSLVKIDSGDWQKVTAELEDVKKRIPTPTPAAKKPAETLSTAQPPTTGVNPPLELPNEGPTIAPTP